MNPFDCLLIVVRNFNLPINVMVHVRITMFKALPKLVDYKTSKTCNLDTMRYLCQNYIRSESQRLSTKVLCHKAHMNKVNFFSLIFSQASFHLNQKVCGRLGSHYFNIICKNFWLSFNIFLLYFDEYFIM